MNRLVVAALVVVLVKIAFLSWVIAGRAAILRDGAEVLLKVEPVDPRDLLRGDYVQLGYNISTVPVAQIADKPSGATTTEAGPITVRVARDSGGFWQSVAAFLREPAAPPRPGEVDIVGSIGNGWSLEPDATLGVVYGIERFYLPEGAGRAIEEDMRVRSFGVRLAVADDGTPQIKALMDGDRTLFEEPLF